MQASKKATLFGWLLGKGLRLRLRLEDFVFTGVPAWLDHPGQHGFLHCLQRSLTCVLRVIAG